MTGSRPRWLWLVVLVPPAAGVLAPRLVTQPHGHWSEHFAGGVLKASQLLVVAALIILCSTRVTARQRMSIVMHGFLVVLMIGILLQAAGDLEVARSIWATAGNPGFGAGYEQGHSLSTVGDLLVLGGGLAFAVTVGIARRAPLWLVAVGAVTTVVPPPFLWPAFGPVLLLLHFLTAKACPVQRGASPKPTSSTTRSSSSS